MMQKGTQLNIEILSETQQKLHMVSLSMSQNTLGLATMVECFSMCKLNCPPFSVVSSLDCPGGGKSSKF